MRWLVLASVLMGCAGSREYKAHDAYLVENSTLVYVEVGKLEGEIVPCEGKECLFFDTAQRYIDARLVAVDANTGAQSDVAGKSAWAYQTQGRNGSGHVIPTPAPWNDVGIITGRHVVSPQGYVAYLTLGDEPSPAVLVGPQGVQPVDVGVLPSSTEVAASELGFTLVAPDPLRVAQVRWEGPVPTSLEPLGVQPVDGPTWKLRGLSPRGSYALIEVFDVEQRDESGMFLGWESRAQKWLVVGLPSGEIAASYDFSSRKCTALTWLTDTELVANFGGYNDQSTVVVRVEGGEFVLEQGFAVGAGHHPPGSDVFVYSSTVVTPEGKISQMDADRGRVFEGRRAWTMGADGDLRVWDLNAATSRSLGRIRGKSKLLGKNAAGLVVIEIGNPSRVWVVNPEDGARRDVVLTTTTADGVEEVGGEI